MAFADAPEFSGDVSADMWKGWFGGDYNQGTFPRDLLFADGDADGMLDVDETLAGLDPTNADSDGDGMTDLYELGAGRDPLTKDKDLGALMAADGRIDDWERLVPDLLQPSDVMRTSGGICANAPRITKYGVLFDGDWLLVAVELDRKPPFGYWIDADITSAERNSYASISTMNGLTSVVGPDHSIPMVAPFTHRGVELHHHRTWLGWGSDVPRDFTVQVRGWFDGAAVACESSAPIRPSWNVP
jgi:hypothetical protein